MPPDPPRPPHWLANDQMSDEEVLRFAPPEIRRVWRRISVLEIRSTEILQKLQSIETLLKERSGAP